MGYYVTNKNGSRQKGRILGVYTGSGTPLTESAIGNRILWQGREYSWKTGLYYFRARWYDPVTGRWLSNDPIGISGGLNQYVFCRDNPINSRDPSGLLDADVSAVAQVIFGETGGLYPQQDRRGSIYSPPTWSQDSEMLLHYARRAVGEVSTRNRRVYSKDGSNCEDSITQRAWLDSEAAALDVAEEVPLLPENVTRFFLRQEGEGKQRPSDLPQSLKPYKTYGPFINVGGGDVPKGNRTYIDFYAP